MDVDKFLLDNKEKYEIINNFQELLKEASRESYPEIIKYVQENSYLFFKDYESGNMFLWNISTFCMFNWTNFEILLDVLIHFSPELIKTKNTELDIIDIFNLMIWTVYYLYSKKVISIESIIKTAEYRNLYYVYFYPEIDQYDHNYSEKLKSTILSDCYIDKDLQGFFKIQKNINKIVTFHITPQHFTKSFVKMTLIHFSPSFQGTIIHSIIDLNTHSMKGFIQITKIFH